MTGTLAGAVGAGAGLSATVYYQLSNATNLKELTGKFYYATVGGELLAGGSVTVFWSPNHKIFGIEVGVSFGAGVSVGVGISYTGLTQFNNPILANIARGVWDAANPGLALAQWLSTAKSAVNSAVASTSSTSSTSGSTSPSRCNM